MNVKKPGSTEATTSTNTGALPQAQPRWRAILWRWLVVVSIQIVAISVFVLFIAKFDNRLASKLEWMGDVWWKWASVGVLIAFALILLGRRGFLGNWGLKKAYLNPPRWLQIVMFVSCVFVIASFLPDIAPKVGSSEFSVWLQQWVGLGPGILFLGSAIVVAFVCSRAKSWVSSWKARYIYWLTEQDEEVGGQAFDLTKLDYEGICQWIKTDDPITSPQWDYFGFARIAERMAERLRETAKGGERSPSFALIGELGSGKSTILKLVEHYLEKAEPHERQVLVVPVSLWPYESVDGAIQGIFSAIEKKFATITSTSAIANAPSRYLKAIGKVAKGADALVELFGAERSPAEALSSFGDLAKLIDVQVVIWVEDMERFTASTGRTQGSQGLIPSQGRIQFEASDNSSQTNERFVPVQGGFRLSASGKRKPSDQSAAPIQALLHQLQLVNRLTVVLASIDLDTRVDLHKIARFVERIPQIEVKVAWPIIARFRKGCLKPLEGPGQWDPAKDEARKILSDEDPQSIQRRADFYGDRCLEADLVQLCRTPRVIKQALREAREVWSNLQGEIDFDDVLIMCIVRIVRPDIFALVDKHLEALRSPSEKAEEAKGAKEAFSNALGALLDASEQEAMEWILGFVFPKFLDETVVIESSKPQGLALKWPHDNWGRFLSLPRLHDQELDQPVLKAIEEWNSGESDVLVAIVSDARHIIAHHYAERIRPNRLVDLLTAVVSERATEPIKSWLGGEQSHVTPGHKGVGPVWLMCLEKAKVQAIDPDMLAKGVEHAITIASKNLALVYDLSRLFLSHNPNSSVPWPLISKEDENRLSKKVQGVVRGYIGDPNGLAQGLKGCEQIALAELVWGYQRFSTPARFIGIPFDQWPELATTIIQAARVWPEIMLPQVALFFAGGGRPSEFKEEVADRLFGIDELKNVFACSEEVLKQIAKEDAWIVKFVRQHLSA